MPFVQVSFWIIPHRISSRLRLFSFCRGSHSRSGVPWRPAHSSPPLAHVDNADSATDRGTLERASYIWLVRSTLGRSPVPRALSVLISSEGRGTYRLPFIRGWLLAPIWPGERNKKEWSRRTSQGSRINTYHLSGLLAAGEITGKKDVPS